MNPTIRGDDEVLYWRRVGAGFGVAGASLVLSLLLWVGLATSGHETAPPPMAAAGSEVAAN